jgi:hypothetical protein
MIKNKNAMGPITWTILISLFTSTGAKAMREVAEWMKDKLPESEPDNDKK